MLYEDYAKLREEKNMSDSEVAKSAGFSPSILSRWKSGQSTPTIKTLRKIKEVLKENLPASEYDAFDNPVHYMHTEFIKKNGEKEVAKFVTSYLLNLPDGSTVELTKKDYDDLQKAVGAFITAWVHSHGE